MLYLTTVRAGADPGGNGVILAAFHQLSAVVAVHAVPFDRDGWHRVSPGLVMGDKCIRIHFSTKQVNDLIRRFSRAIHAE